MKLIAITLVLFISSTAVAQGLNSLLSSHSNDTGGKAIHIENTEIVPRDFVPNDLPRSTFLNTFLHAKLLLSNSHDNLHASSHGRNFSDLSAPLTHLSSLYPDPSHAIDSLPESSAQGSAQDSLDLDERQMAFNIYAVPAEEEIMIEGVSYMAELTVYDLKGKKREPTPSYPYHKGMRLNIHQLRSGIYVLHIKDEELNKMMKLVKK